MHGGGKGATNEKMETAYGQIQNELTQYRQGLMRMTVSQGVDSSTFDTRPQPFSAHDNSNCTSNACYVYHPNGGAMSPPKALDASIYESTVIAPRLAVNNINRQGTPLYDIIFLVPRVSSQFCEFYNAKVGLQSGTSSSVNSTNAGGGYGLVPAALAFTGAANNWSGSLGGNGGATFLENQDQGCYYNTNSSGNGAGYYILAVVYPR